MGLGVGFMVCDGVGIAVGGRGDDKDYDDTDNGCKDTEVKLKV